MGGVKGTAMAWKAESTLRVTERMANINEVGKEKSLTVRGERCTKEYFIKNVGQPDLGYTLEKRLLGTADIFWN